MNFIELLLLNQMSLQYKTVGTAIILKNLNLFLSLLAVINVLFVAPFILDIDVQYFHVYITARLIKKSHPV